MIAGLDNEALLGLGIDDEVLVGLDLFLNKVRRRLTAVQDAARKVWSRLSGRALSRSLAEDEALDAATNLLDGVMRKGVRSALFTPGAVPDPVTLGELGEGRLAGGAMRDVMDVAGGGAPGNGTMIGNGPYLVSEGEAAGIHTQTFRWDYTMAPRTQNFKPHLDLNGMVFERDDDPRLASSSFISGFYRPGDHRGCLCVVVREQMCQVGLVAAGVELPPCGAGPDFSHIETEAGDLEDVEFDFSTRSDPWLRTLWNRAGYDRPGQVVSRAEFDALGGTEYQRGIHPLAGGKAEALRWAEDLRTGDYFPGTGMHGNGVYSAYGETLERVAGYAGPDGTVVRFKLKPAARVIDSKDLDRLIDDYLEELTQADMADSLRTRLREVAEDPGRFATMMRYDAIDVKRSNYLVLLNRTMAIFEEAI